MGKLLFVYVYDSMYSGKESGVLFANSLGEAFGIVEKAKQLTKGKNGKYPHDKALTVTPAEADHTGLTQVSFEPYDWE